MEPKQTTETVSLKTATKAQMMRFAETTLGFELAEELTENQMRAKISAVWEKKEIVLELLDEPEVERVKPPAEKNTAKGDPIYEVIIAETEEPGGAEPVPLQVNGRLMYVPRGKSVRLKLRYYEVLARAVTTNFHQKEGSNDLIPRYVKKYPHSVVRSPSDEEVQAFYKRDADASQKKATANMERDMRQKRAA